MAAVRDVVVRFLGNAQGLNQAADQGAAAVGKFSDRTKKMATVGLAGVAAFGAGLVSMLKGGVEGLQEGEEAEAKFAQAMSKVPKTLKVSEDAVKSYAEAVQAKTRFSYEDALATSGFLAAQDGVQSAIRAGVVTTEQATAVALDLATAQGTDGVGAAKTLAKWLAAPEKATGALRKAGIALSAAEQKKIKSWTESGDVGRAQALILDKVKAKTEGAAEAAGNTMAGKAARASAAFGEMQESLATGLIPVLQTLTSWGLRISGWLQDNPEKVKLAVIVLGGLAAVIGTVSLAIKAWTFITKVHTAVMAALNVVMFANPAVLIAVAIVALVAVVVLIAKKTTWFQQIWSAAWGGIKAAMSAGWDLIKSVAGWIADKFSWVGTMVKAYVGIWWTVISTVFGRIKDGAAKMKDGIVTVFSGIGDVITAPFRAAVDGIKSVWNSTLGGKGFHAPDWVPGIGGKGFTIPMLAAGGTVSRRGWTMVGERGPEFLNLGRGAQVVPLDRAGGDTTVEIHATGPTLQDIVEVKIRDANRATRRAVLAGSSRTI